MSFETSNIVGGYAHEDGVTHFVIGTRRTDGGIAWGGFALCGKRVHAWPNETEHEHVTCLGCSTFQKPA